LKSTLRKGGTTHPFYELKFVDQWSLRPIYGVILQHEGREKYYIATDNLQKERYRGYAPGFNGYHRHHRLHFDSSTKTGNVFHLMGSLSEFGKLGVTSIGILYNRPKICITGGQGFG
jgi:hypothetical protein